MADADVDVLIAGAGPSGLTLAIELGRRGVTTQIIDRHPGPRSGSRGCTIWHRSLEVFDLMGLPVMDFLDSGCRLSTRYYHFAGAEPLRSSLVEPASPYPHPLVISQADTERFLRAGAQWVGVPVRWQRTAVAAEPGADRVRVQLAGPSGPESLTARWLVLAQGSRAALRAPLGFDWRTTDFTGSELIQVDARLAGTLPNELGESHLFFTDEGTLGCLPLPDGRHRLFCAVRSTAATAAPELPELTHWIRRLSGHHDLRLSDPRFAWRVKLYNGIADTFRRDRVLLLGDSAHTVVPVSAQGMNTGIQDAFNLGWKLAAAVRCGDDALIDSYHDERYPVAQALLRRTTASYWGGVGTAPTYDGMLAGIGRTSQARSQLAPGYRDGVLAGAAASAAGGPAVGDRLDDAELVDATGRPHRVFELIGPDWVALDLPAPGRPRPERPHAVSWRGQPVVVHTVLAPGQRATGSELVDAGLARTRYGLAANDSAVLLVRPDGHLAQRSDTLADLLAGVRT